MFLTKEDLHVFYHQVHQIVAKKLGIANCELKSASELVEEIEILSPEISFKVKAFIKAYERWFEVNQNIDAAGSSGNLSTQENETLMAAINERDRTREELISGLNQL